MEQEGGAGTGVTQDLKEKDCSFLYGAGEVIQHHKDRSSERCQGDFWLLQ